MRVSAHQHARPACLRCAPCAAAPTPPERTRWRPCSSRPSLYTTRADPAAWQQWRTRRTSSLLAAAHARWCYARASRLHACSQACHAACCITVGNWSLSCRSTKQPAGIAVALSSAAGVRGLYTSADARRQAVGSTPGQTRMPWLRAELRRRASCRGHGLRGAAKGVACPLCLVLGKKNPATKGAGGAPFAMLVCMQ